MNRNYNPVQSTCHKIQYSSQSGTNHFTLHSATTEAERARLLSVSSEGASDWLHAIPIPSLSLHLDTMSLHIACGLHLGATLCHPHECNCGEMVEPNGRHGLKCKKALGFHLCGHFVQILCQESFKRSVHCSSRKRSQKSGKIQQFVRLSFCARGHWDLRCLRTLQYLKPKCDNVKIS